MRVSESMFVVDHAGQSFRVLFAPGRVTVEQSGCELPLLKIGDQDAIWKPCATHAKELVRMAIGLRPPTQHAKNRAESVCEARPGDILAFRKCGA